MATQTLGKLVVNNPQQKAKTGTGAPAKTSLSMHNAGQLAGHALNALPGYNTFSSNVTNPKVNYLGVPNPSVPEPAPAYSNGTSDGLTSGQNTGQNSDGTYNSISGSGSSGASPTDLLANFMEQKNNVYGTANDAADNSGITLKNNILDYIDSLRSGQTAIDNKAVNNELAKRQGTQGILGMVSRGIRSGNVVLANKNASSSSATDAIAHAYAELGRGQLSNIGNQFEMGNHDIATAQTDFNTQRASGARKLADSKLQTVNNIVADARDSFAKLDAQMANASLPDRIAIEQEKENVRSQVLARLQQYDQLLQQEASTIAPTSEDARRAKAIQMSQEGTAPENAFQVSTDLPAQLQDSGALPSDLPLFTFPSKKEFA